MQAECRGNILIYYYIHYAEAQPTEAENRLPQAILGKLSELTAADYIDIPSPLFAPFDKGRGFCL